MKAKKLEKKLQLNKLTVADLDFNAMAGLRGGRLVTIECDETNTVKCACDEADADIAKDGVEYALPALK